VGFIMTDNAQENINAFGSLDIIPQDAADELEDVMLSDSNDEDDEINWENYRTLDLEDTIDVPRDNMDEQCEDIFEDICDWTQTKLIQLGCITHALELVIKECIRKNPRCSEIIAYMNRLTTFFSKSPYWHGKLVETSKIGLIKIGDTRWNGILLALKRLLRENFIHQINTVLEQPKCTAGRRTGIPDLISPELEADLGIMSELLTPFLDLTNDLQGEGVTSSRAILGIITCYKKVASVNCDEYMRALRGSLCLALSARFATVLDPRWKLAPFDISLPEPYKLNLYVPSQDVAKKVLIDAFNFENRDVDSCSLLETDESREPKRAKNDFLSSFLPQENLIHQLQCSDWVRVILG
ncbi:unnamed protein product, partial [Allacma fusca]